MFDPNDPASLEAWATAAGVAVAIVFGATGLVLGIVGAVQATRAKKQAIRSNEIAEAANELSAEANRLVQQANQVVNQQADRATERHDVDWTWWFDDALRDHVVIQNIGKNLAKEVTAQFFYEGAVEANQQPFDVNGREEFKFQIPGLAKARKFAAEVELNGIAWAIATHDSPPPGRTARVRLRVHWITPMGTPKTFDTHDIDAPL